MRLGAVLLFSLVAISSTIAPTVEAASRSHTNYWRYSSEGNVSTTTLDRGTSRRGITSAAQKAIDALGNNPVEDISIPVLLGVSVADLSPNFGDPRDGGTRTHEGEDIIAPKDGYIVSPTNAVVISMGTGESAGNYVYTANPGGETFAYMHLSKFATNLKVGDVFSKGDLIGYVGNTGDASGGPTHLHFEIRQSRTPTDPYPRLTKTFTLEERVNAVTKVLKNAEDENEDARMLVSTYRSIFVLARAQGIDLPSSIESALGVSADISVSATTFIRNLTVGMRGDDVIALQTVLISKSTGPKALLLLEAGSTGYFGALTQAALAEYQATHAISPAVGYFGPITRAQIAAAL